MLILTIDIGTVLRYDYREVITMTFGERLAMYIEKAGMSQKQLAEAIEVTPTRLNYWVKDKREPDVFYIKALAKALGVTGDDLLGTHHEQSDILYISRPTGNESTDELRKRMHDLIDQLDDKDLRLLSDVAARFDKNE